MASAIITGAGNGPPAARPPMPQPGIEQPDDFAPSPFWTPDYQPDSIMPPNAAAGDANVITVRSTSISPAMIMQDQPMTRKTKIVCTMGPKCWDEETMGQLIDAGMGVARFNFSHGDHDAHQGVLDRFRKVCAEKKATCAVLLDTKGPEVRTAMLKNHEPIEIEAGQEVIVYAAGPDEYTSWEGYKTPEETKIGCSYAKLCQSVKPGNKLLFADGSLSIEVLEILDDRNLKGRALNSKKLGERKNGNLPGVKVELDVLQPKDVDDIKNFACKNKMDYIAVSFVQTGEDVQMVRKILDENGGENIQIISKIENEEGMRNFDEILKYTDGVMVARGDLGMEIPSEKVALAQKMMITKCNIAGKFSICATQMLESMCDNPLPTRAEMTDVANAVFDGADATMLSGETANGAFPAKAVATMAAIVSNAELGIDYWEQYNFLHRGNAGTHTITTLEASLGNVALSAVEYSADKDGDGVIDATEGTAVVVLTEDGVAADFITKYRPPCPVFVATNNQSVMNHTNTRFGQIPVWIGGEGEGNIAGALRASSIVAKEKDIPFHGNRVIVVSCKNDGFVHVAAVAHTVTVQEDGAYAHSPSDPIPTSYTDPGQLNSVVSLRSSKISLDSILKPASTFRKTKTVCTMGPKCWSEDGMRALLRSGMGVARFNFSHGDHEAHQEVLDRYRSACKKEAAAIKAELGLDYTPHWASLLDTKGPEIRTAMLRDHEPIYLDANQEIFVEAVGDKYTEFEGYKTPEETRIGLSYAKLCQSVKPGNNILIADGSVVIKVTEIISDTVLKGTVLNSKKLGERKNCNLPGVKVDIPVLTAKDINDVQNFCCKNKMDFVAASFVQTGEDVQLIRKTLDDAGGQNVQIICKIENEAGMENFDEILKYTDGVMVARGDLGMEIPSEKVALAQKMMITKCNIAGKFVICATQMLESMCDNPLPTRAEMLDVANAVFDGADATMLSGETANGAFPAKAVATMAAIAQNAEEGLEGDMTYQNIWNNTPKPVSPLEATASSAVKACLDMGAVALVVFADMMLPATLLSKYKPPVPIVVVTTNPWVAAQSNVVSGLVPMLLDELDTRWNGGVVPTSKELMPKVISTIRKLGIADLQPGDEQADQVIVIERPGANPMVSDRGVDQAAFKTYIIGDEAVDLIKSTGYDGAHTISFCSTRIGLDNVVTESETVRKTKIVCTMGPKCWDEETMGQLIDAGMGVARFNFSHGDHDAHQGVLDRFRKVCAEKKATCAVLLDTKGPEVRTAMLKNHEPIELEAGQEIIVYAAGPDEYTSWEGYKTPEETKIGCSYAKLCQSVKPGNKLLFADGSVVIKVTEIIDDKNLRGIVMNDKKLGERKNGNLPGVKVELDVLQPKDVDDIKNFACKNKMDYIAVSFVQTGEDVQMVRKILDENGGENIQIISKIENEEGMRNFDEILKYTDGVMVARGDLGMEIPSEKVALAQKMMITKCNIAGKFSICATQMLESMCDNPLPTRAEMTDVANAVFDGADATMLSGETANGAFPAKAVATMAAIAANAEEGVNHCQVYNFIRDFTPMPVGTIEAVVSCASKTAVDLPELGCIVCFSESGYRANLCSKYRPRCPIVVVTHNESVVKHTNTVYGQYAFQIPIPATWETERSYLTAALAFAVEKGLCKPGAMVAVIGGVPKEVVITKEAASSHVVPSFHVTVAPGVYETSRVVENEHAKANAVRTVSLRATAISLDEVFSPEAPVRKTKIVCTMGPKCWDEEELGQLIDAGMGVARFNFSHGDHGAQQKVLDRARKVAAEKGSFLAYLLDTKGPEIRTAMLRDHEPIELEANQEIFIEAVGDKYVEFEGYKTPEETRIGLSYAKLCQSVKPGNNILIADGSVVIKVTEIISDTVLKGTVLNSKKLGERKNCNLPGVKVDIPVLTAKDIDDVQNFCCKNKMDFVAASFVQTGEDVQLIRKTLDDAGGQNVQIISKIENEEGVANIDDILRYSDGIMVARGDLGMEIPSEKVALAQKMLITKANVAGRFVICATQMLESMCGNPLPTRAEMTDVANAVFDGADATMLSGETANGAFPAKAVATMAAIVQNAELAKTSAASVSFLRDFTQRPFTTLESAAASAAAGAIDCAAELIIVISSSGVAARAMSKYSPPCPILVVTADESVARHTGAYFGQYPMLVPDLTSEKYAVDRFSPAVSQAKGMKLMKEWQGMKRTPSSLDLSKQPAPAAKGGNVIVVAGPDGGCADNNPVVSFL